MFQSFRKAATLMKRSDRLTAALAPEDAVVVDAPEPFLREALAGAAAGDPVPAAALLRRTREERDWDARSRAVDVLAEASTRAPAWLDAWLEASPEDPDALLVRAKLLVVQAWEARSGARAKNVEQDQWQGFFALLGEATPVISAVVDALPDDPSPWPVAIAHGIGASAPRDVFEEYLAAFADIDPHHIASHTTALSYLTKKWHGSHAESFEYADRVAAQAPEGLRLVTLPLVAEFEHLVEAGRAVALTERRAELDRAVALAQDWVERYGAQDPRGTAETRNLLALVLFFSERYEEAYAQMVAIGADATAFPWDVLRRAARQLPHLPQAHRHQARRDARLSPLPAAGRR